MLHNSNRVQPRTLGDNTQLSGIFDKNICRMDYNWDKRKRTRETKLKSVNLDGISLVNYEGGTLQGIRNRGHLLTQASDDFLLVLPIDSKVNLSQDQNSANFESGQFCFISTAKPFIGRLTPLGEVDHIVYTTARLSGSLIRQRIPNIDDICVQPITIQSGIGKIGMSLIDVVLHEGGALTTKQSRDFSTMLFDLIAEVTLTSPELLNFQPKVPRSAKVELQLKAQDYIVANLSDPTLDATKVANHFKVSTRYLRAAFCLSNTTVGTFIREARLQHCRKALCSPQLMHRPILEIAMMWGFNEASYFSRAYRTKFGHSPSDERAKMQLSNT